MGARKPQRYCNKSSHDLGIKQFASSCSQLSKAGIALTRIGCLNSDKIPHMKNTRNLLVFLFSCAFLITACQPATQTPAPPSAKSGEVLYQDDFSDNTSGWDRVVNDGGIMDYDSGGYRILIQEPNLNYWSTPGKYFGNVRVETDVTKLNGPDENRAGVICRYQNGNYYFFIISNDGYYAIGKFLDGQAVLIGQESMLPTEYIQAEGVNHLRADCFGSTLLFYVNYNQIAVVRDSDFQTGDIGLVAGAFDEPGVDVLFQNFVVTQP